MLNKKFRIPKSIFRELKKPYKTVSLGYLTAMLFKLPALSSSKFSVSISKKHEKRAVLRNRLRRAVYRELKNQIDKIENGMAIQFIFNSKPEKSEDVSVEVKNILNKIQTKK